MKVTRAQADENRRRIVDAAGALFKQKGFGGVAVADIMGEVGLTHGGFYGNFASKEDLAAETTAAQLKGAAERWSRILDGAAEAPLQALLLSYFSGRNRREPASGCSLAALGTDVTRSGPAVKAAFTSGLAAMIDLVAEKSKAPTTAARRTEAASLVAGMVGALVLARAVDDESLGDEIVAATIDRLLS